jgi:glutathione S-transferase
MKLYFIPGACSLASHIALLEAGLAFELVRVEKRDGAKIAGGEDYLRVTPKGYVPALRLDGGEVLTETTAMLPFVADLTPGSGLAPPLGSLQRYRLHEWLGYIGTELHKSFGAF